RFQHNTKRSTRSREIGIKLQHGAKFYDCMCGVTLSIQRAAKTKMYVCNLGFEAQRYAVFHDSTVEITPSLERGGKIAMGLRKIWSKLYGSTKFLQRTLPIALVN